MSSTGATPSEDLASSLKDMTSELQELRLSCDTSLSKPRHASDRTYLLRKPSKKNSLPIRSASDQETRTPSPLVNSNQCMQILENHEHAVFLFADMQEFTLRAQEMDSEDLMHLLNKIYSDFLSIVERIGAEHGIETVKFTGDCIMLAASSVDEAIQTQQVKAMVNVGWHLSQHISRLNETRREDPINFRFGINMGPAVKVQIRFGETQNIDWIGEGVNKAARMESSSIANQIQITENIFQYIQDDFECSPCIHEVKSYDKPTTFFVACPKKKASSSQEKDPSPLIEDLGENKQLKKRHSISQPSLSPRK